MIAAAAYDIAQTAWAVAGVVSADRISGRAVAGVSSLVRATHACSMRSAAEYRKAKTIGNPAFEDWPGGDIGG